MSGYVFWCTPCKTRHAGACAPTYNWSPNLVRTIKRTDFVHIQAQLFVHQGISFVHLVDDEAALTRAVVDFKSRVNARLIDRNRNNESFYHAKGNVAAFVLCRMQGRALEHVPAMFIDGPEGSFREQRALSEARYIPASVPGFPATVFRPVP